MPYLASQVGRGLRSGTPRTRLTAYFLGWHIQCGPNGSRRCGGDFMAASEDDRQSARELAALATTHVGWASRDRMRRAAIRVSRGRFGRRSSRLVVPAPGTGWQDNPSERGSSWRERAAYLNGQSVFEVDYQVCRRCRTGWVEDPWTEERYERCGLAAAGLAALRTEHPGLSWHTAGGHMPDSELFWRAIAAGIHGGYQYREICAHRAP